MFLLRRCVIFIIVCNFDIKLTVKCFSFSEPPINCPNENKDLINVFLWNDFANVDLENCSIIGFKPEVVSKNGDQKLQACLGLDERRPGQMWIEGSARFTEVRYFIN